VCSKLVWWKKNRAWHFNGLFVLPGLLGKKFEIPLRIGTSLSDGLAKPSGSLG